MDLKVSFFLTIIIGHLDVVQSHLCVLEKRPDPSRGGALRWSLLFAEICLCQRVVAPVFLNAKTCPRREYEDGDLWFVDDPQPLIMRYNRKKDTLDHLLDRPTFCKCTLGTDNCDANAACTNVSVGSFTCTCDAGYRGDGVTCTVCIDYLGIRNGDIPDENIKASSEYSSRHTVSKGRLNGKPPTWHAAASQNGTTWIQADIGYQTYVSGVITQGDGTTGVGVDYVTSFKVSTFLADGAKEVFVEDQNGNAIIFPGNVDTNSEVTTTFPQPVYTRIVRVNCLTKYRSLYALRFEILGCKTN
ncbi:retinoschisin-like [Amphiura filiformis]|uniref:retinoschisin-like n=1 Tax=Amphiura filiformis TaxID=82378 RepID=UPI003B22172B